MKYLKKIFLKNTMFLIFKKRYKNISIKTFININDLLL